MKMKKRNILDSTESLIKLVTQKMQKNNSRT